MMPSTTLLPTTADIELRLVDLADIPENALRPQSRQESVRAARFQFARHRHRYLAGRFMLRQMLADWSGLAPASLRFTEIGNGKPILLDVPCLHFNLSYADDAILIGVTRQSRIGVDIERRRPFPAALALAQECFDRVEQTALRQARSDTAQSDLFLCGWTRKEACLKAAALGLAHDPALIVTGLEPRAREVTITPSLHTQVETLVRERYMLSWAKIL